MAYPIDFIQASSANYTPGRESVNWLLIHYTGTNASAKNNAEYFSKPNYEASAHYFIDGSGIIWQSVKEEDTAWHAGNWYVNARSIGIEVVSAGQGFTQSEKDELKYLVTLLMAKYGITSDRVIRHYDVPKYAQGQILEPYKKCPAPYVNDAKWTALHSYITAVEGWQKDESGWWWRNADGTWPANCWKRIKGAWYFFRSDGYMATGWIEWEGNWYFCADDGEMLTGWQSIAGNWYHLKSDGSMSVGWLKDNGNWYFLNNSGQMACNCFMKIAGRWYAFNRHGKMVEELTQLSISKDGDITIG